MSRSWFSGGSLALAIFFLIPAGSVLSKDFPVRPLNAAEAPGAGQIATGLAKQAREKIFPVRIASPAAVQVAESSRRGALEELAGSIRGFSESGAAIR